MSNFTVEFYETEDGDKPLIRFMDSIDGKLAAKLGLCIRLLMDGGPNLRAPYSKYLAEGIFELRAKQSTNIARALYFFAPGRLAVITHGFVKKQDKTPVAELDRAVRYRHDWERRRR